MKKFTFDDKQYQIKCLLGIGSQAAVFKCFSDYDQKTVTCRVFLEDFDELVKERQYYQLQQQQIKRQYIQYCLRFHKIIIQQTPTSTITNRTAILQILEFGDYKLTDQNMNINFDLKMKLVYQMAIAINDVHKHNLIHRDIKPDNIYLTEKMDVLLSDFGIARKNDQSLKTKIGTISYAAPEVWLTVKETDEKDFARYGYEVDIWSFGCVIYYLVTDDDLFDGVNVEHYDERIEETKLEKIQPEFLELILQLVVIDIGQRKQNWEKLKNHFQLK
uniref:Kinase, NEK n=1 Tax=Trepomonas sp. PC1 TaxID=1076344 RepID=A0A146K9A1_9EUKA|eukprot:JAP93167.1 Kinase, NEK [Trepomonas sp. PC1]